MPCFPVVLWFGLFYLQICGVTLNDQYISYFKHQAVAHPDLLHQVGQNEVFEVVGVEEALGTFRSTTKEKDIVMRLIMYTFGVSDNGNHEELK